MSSSIKNLLSERIQKKQKELHLWFEENTRRAPPPFYSSVDLRDADFKIVPVDSNLYPAGFNNLCQEDIRTAPNLMRDSIYSTLNRLGLSSPKRILILPESHTHNAFYIENIYNLMQIISNAGYEVRLGWYDPSSTHNIEHPFSIESTSKKELQAHPIHIQSGILSAGGFVPDMVLLNNDFSSGYPEPLDSVTQPIIPSYALGWHSRKKSEHFLYYNQLAAEFASILEVDPWMIQIDTQEITPVNFNENQGTEQVAKVVDQFLQRIGQTYKERGIPRKPFVFIKNNAGTYGIGIMQAHSADELRYLNRRIKNKMSVGKSHRHINSVIVQEGIPTSTHVDHLAAEPVIYLLGCELIGGFLRTHPKKNEEENLNSPGMVFQKLCMSDLRKPERGNRPTLELVYGSIARISALATGKELQTHHVKRPLETSLR